MKLDWYLIYLSCLYVYLCTNKHTYICINIIYAMHIHILPWTQRQLKSTPQHQTGSAPDEAKHDEACYGLCTNEQRGFEKCGNRANLGNLNRFCVVDVGGEVDVCNIYMYIPSVCKVIWTGFIRLIYSLIIHLTHIKKKKRKYK